MLPLFIVSHQHSSQRAPFKSVVSLCTCLCIKPNVLTVVSSCTGAGSVVSVVTALLLINEAKPALKASAFTILSHRYTVPQSHVLCLLLMWVLLSVPGVWLGCFC